MKNDYEQINVWRLQLNTGGGNIGEYCYRNHVASIGWSFVNQNISLEELGTIKDDFSRYEKMCKKVGWSCNSNVRRLAFKVKEGDIIWMHYGGKYYFARVTENSHWRFNCDLDLQGKQSEAFNNDACNQITDINWIEAGTFGDEISIPGAIATGFFRGSTFQRINKYGVKEFSQYLYNLYAKDSFLYPYPKLRLTKESFYAMLLPEDAEDLAYSWLYSKYKYIVIPSSNKISTQKYEFVMLDPDSEERKHIYLQVKKGDVDLDVNEYTHLNGEVYLFTTNGEIKNYNACKHKQIHIIDPDEVFKFAMNVDNHKYISDSIIKWCKLLTEIENITQNPTGVKGIMFDTNRGIDRASEMDMLLNNKISAYGKAKRYIRSFRKGDYVLYYACGKGIFAMGQITSDSEIKSGDDELYQTVSMIIPQNRNWETEEYQYLTPHEIKKILNKGFYFASTIKTPFLDISQVKMLERALERKYQKKP